jgi:FkbM family methyltransferase
MSFASYAQNLEDVMLWRALKHVRNGFYVDVGAQHPVVDSVSKAFYERGWRGIHIEPVPHYADLLRKDRPDETVMQIALGAAEGVLELNVIPHTGLSTAVDAYAERHRVELGYQPRRITVPVLTLKSALQSLPQDVHWLKIDVEGFEEQVLKGWDSSCFRPWVILVEATLPNSPKTDYAGWDPILTNANYRFVYFDGLNRFYIAEEHEELREAFSCPPNIFDDAVLALPTSWLSRGLIALRGTTRDESEDRRLQGSAEKLRHAIDAVLYKARLPDPDVKALVKSDRERRYADELQSAADRLRDAIDAVRSETEATKAASAMDVEKADGQRPMNDRQEQEHLPPEPTSSWRISKLSRWTSAARRHLSHSLRIIPVGLIRAQGKALMWQLVPFVVRRPRLMRTVRRMVGMVPGLEHRLRRIMLAKSEHTPQVVQPMLKELRHLAPRGIRIYTAMTHAVEASTDNAHRH